MTLLSEINPHSRIWIYQSRTELTPEVQDSIRKRASAFLEEWTSHGNRMVAAFDILHNRFMILAVDEQTAPASGCGVDKSVRFIQDLEKEFGVSLLDRMNVAWEQAGKVLSARLPEFEQLLAEGKVGKDTLVFNNLIENRGQLDHSWRIPLSESWHSRLLKS